MKRFVTIDFLRGFAIFMMLCLHTLMRIYDQSWINGDISQKPVITIIFLLLAMFFGSWAGFFLLISAIGNTISMQKSIEKGSSVSSIVLKQVLGGFILLIFAMLSEALIGYHGSLSEAVELVFANSTRIIEGMPYSWINNVWLTSMWRFYHQETINGVAWCIIVNGIIHGLLSMNNGNNKPKRNIIIYLVLTVVVLALTNSVWKLANLYGPGYPFATDPKTGYSIQYAVIGSSSFVDYVIRFFLAPIVGHPEPLFPFLAVSFIGSIMGIILTAEHPPADFPHKGILIGFILFIVGTIATAYYVLFGTESFGHFSGNFWNIPGLGLLSNGNPNVWFWWLMCTTGAQMIVILLLFRMIEYRGKAKPFAEKTKYFRRIGAVAFTVYNFQFIDLIPRFFIGLIPGINVLANPTNGYVTLLVMSLYLIEWGIVLRLWEKVNYVGSLEWMIALIRDLIIPKSKKDKELAKAEKKPWYLVDRFKIQETFYNAEWIEFVKRDEINHQALAESKLAYKLSLIGFIFPPGCLMGFRIGKGSEKEEQVNKYNHKAKIIGIIGIIFWLAFFFTMASITGLSF